MSESEQDLLEQARKGDGVAVQRLLLLHHEAAPSPSSKRRPRPDLTAAD